MDDIPASDTEVEAVWLSFLMKGEVNQEKVKRKFLRFLPGNPRCKWCYSPLSGVGSSVARVFYGKRPSIMNPKICNMCEEFAKTHQGGAEVELTLLFADVRGSTTIAESMSPMAFSNLINRFYNASTHVMTHTDALIDKIIGDQVAGMYVPGMVGELHAAKAIDAAVELLRATGHGSGEEPWIPLGIGVHTGMAFVGSVGSTGGMIDITVLGDTANTTARLSSKAATGEILISDSAYMAAGRAAGGLETRELELKGKSNKVRVHVLNDI